LRREGIDYLLVETTGLADSLPVALTFLRSEVRERVRLDAIVTVADAGEFSLDRFSGKVARNQLRYADTILLNKCDLASADRLAVIEAQIRSVNAGARILRTTWCQIPPALILGLGAALFDRNYAHHDRDHDHMIDGGFGSLSFSADRPFAADKFQCFLERLPTDVFRAKGVIWIAERDESYIFHLVGQRFTLDARPRMRPQENKLVLIGRNLDHRQLRARLEACLTAPLRPAGACAES
jgi:G3E family GTPase